MYRHANTCVQVHSLGTKGRYREAFDSFWNLQAQLSVRGIFIRIIGLTATLRPSDVPDILRRMSTERAMIFRASCFRAGLKFVFESGVGSESDAVCRASQLAAKFAKSGKVMIFTSTVRLCDEVAQSIRQNFHG